mgnify:CR=1 FL=1
MITELETMNRKELERLQERITKQLEKRDIADRKEALAAAQKAAKAHGYDLSDLTSHTTKPRAASGKRRATRKPKYANPSDKAQTWTGRGRQPQWFKDAVASGKTPEDLAI